MKNANEGLGSVVHKFEQQKCGPLEPCARDLSEIHPLHFFIRLNQISKPLVLSIIQMLQKIYISKPSVGWNHVTASCSPTAPRYRTCTGTLPARNPWGPGIPNSTIFFTPGFTWKSGFSLGVNRIIPMLTHKEMTNVWWFHTKKGENVIYCEAWK